MNIIKKGDSLLKKIILLGVLLCTFFVMPNVSAKGWVQTDGYKYYVDDNNNILTGFQNIDGKTYFLSRDKTRYGALREGMIKIGEETFYLNPDLKKGWFEYNGNKYYANEQGEIQVGVQEVDGKIYFFSRDKTKYGANKTGMFLLGDKAYYFNPTARTGWFKYNGNKYYANEKGEIQVGVQEVDGEIYFFSGDKTKYGANKTGMFLLGDKAYYFNPEAKIGWFEYNGNKYYANEKGEIQVGVQEVDGKIYFFSGDKTKYGANKTGMLLLGDKAYYFNPEAKIGWFEYNGNKYYANEHGEIQIGLVKIDEKKYYFSQNKEDYGQMKVGFQQIDGKRYFFSQAKEMYGQMRIGWIEVYGYKMYLNEDGSQAFGFTIINGNTYFFSNDLTKYGAMIKGWITYNNLYYYFNDDGIMQKGLKNINGRDYNFDETTGILQGFVNKDGKLYYYNPDGTQAKGVQYMINKYWKFNELTGEFENYARQIRVIDISSHNGIIDWQTVKNSNQVDAVILRLGYGYGYVDSSFIRNKNE